MKSVDRPEGFREKQAEITAQRLHRIAELQSMMLAEAAPIAEGNVGGGSSTTTSRAPSANTPPPANQPAATPDYDEIPF